MRVRKLMAIAILALCALAAGCGDDDSDSAQSDGPSVSTSSLSKEEFIKQAGAACNRERIKGVRSLSTYAEENKGATQGELLAGVFVTVLPSAVEAEMDAIRKLGAPAGDEDEIEAILVALQEGVDTVKQVENPKSGAEFPTYFAEADEMLQEYGLVGCARNAS